MRAEPPTMTGRLSERSIYLLIVLAGIALFMPFLGAVHLFDWDEINFAEAAREMIVTGNYTRVQIDYEPFCEKPPLFIWAQVASMKAFGVHEFAARFPNAVVGIVTLLVLWHLMAVAYDLKLILPPPLTVARTIVNTLTLNYDQRWLYGPNIYEHLGSSFVRAISRKS